jgi:nucleotide sugar dehydrogenase
MNSYNPKLLLAGYGNIGKHIINEFSKFNFVIYDKYQKEYADDLVLEEQYDIAFVAVPTEMLPSGECDLSCINDIIGRIKADTIVVKSAVPVGTFDNYPDNIIVSPEFYGTTQHSLEFPNFVVLGGNKKNAKKVAQLYYHVKTGDFKVIFVNQHTAELAKYMENCWIASKVTFCNEFARIAKNVGVDYDDLRECFIADERVSPSHTFVYDEKPFYDSHCLNKDIPALIYDCEKKNIDVPFMNGVKEANRQQKAEFYSNVIV